MKDSQKRSNIFSDSELKYMNDLILSTKKPYMTNAEIVNSIMLYRTTGEQKYCHSVVNNFIKLLVKLARKYKKPGVNIGDLVHYGLQGLMEAIERAFNLNANEKFITYITIIIERRMKDGLDYQRGAVVFPKNIMTQQRKIMYSTNGSVINFTIEDEFVVESKSADETVLYSKINIGNHVNDLRSVIDEDDELDTSIEESIDYQSLQFDIFHILEVILTPVERDVIIHYFGLNGESAKAYDAISSILNISSQKIRKIRNIALEKIKNNQKARIILEKYLS